MTISSIETDVQNKQQKPQQVVHNPLESKGAADKAVARLKPDSIRYLQRSIHDYICQAIQLYRQKNKLLQQAEYLSSKLHERM
ncbi:MAG: hypothetical protein AAF320_05790 [Myxococcota bacterium]